ncbi:3-hydroxyacyl-CoA dehydrogenase NAD-binding domain-containing protein [Gryllotalpicola protaetiae]|uniref:3-hydroxyacyl-CoA dehydrogenase n=1 Tax=Gryllotalpicola protaetiae TaxID=2419771 RepID=A0A387C367_9MICO|nr:3-hydroxyacyl-CoA dehydrogenase NAD-binding domain-containing protein [Gryllotalpicola protaetiae]AYG05001.1 3-hydroxyacyl-CoA dehydrogenase [Gryllotalpicola protaetiae]
MTDYSKIDFSPLLQFSDDEVVTHSFVKDVALPSGKRLALITLDNGRDHTRPSTLGPATLIELSGVLDELTKRAAAGEIDAVGITGKPFILAAGADLSKVTEIPSRDAAKLLAQLGHATYLKLGKLGVPSFAFVNGLALGGGVEIPLNSTYRTVDSSAAAIALPEVFLGIIPGWGGATLLPNLIGIENALKVVIENPLKMNRMLSAKDAYELGIFDAMFDHVNYLEDSLKWADGVLAGSTKVERPNQPGRIERTVKWPVAIKIARDSLESRIGTVPKSPYVALDLLSKAKDGDIEAGFAREDDALADLISGDQFAASIYAFNLVQHRAKRPVGAPDKSLAKKVGKVGVIGAGLMASQFALLFLRRLEVPVVITDLDQERVDKGLAYIHDELQKLADKGRLNPDQHNKLKGLISGTTDRSQYADCDWVIEAVFEELSVKQDVFAEFEKIVSPEAVFATNTSSLSVDAIGAKLEHPERLVGFHFFNPVAVMPLIEVVKAPQTDDTTVATAMAVAKNLKKNAIITTDSTGFVVNRVLAKVLGESMRAVDDGTPFSVVDEALAPLGLPMPPSVLLDLVGLKVGAHVLDTHHAAWPDRFYRSENLHRVAAAGQLIEKDAKGKSKGVSKEAERIVKANLNPGATPHTKEQVLQAVQDGFTEEVHRMLEEGVVSAPEDIDLALILGAGFPFQMGGLTPYLDRVGASERVFGGTFHDPRIVGAETRSREAQLVG